MFNGNCIYQETELSLLLQRLRSNNRDMDAILSKDEIPSAAGIIRDGEALCQVLHGLLIGSGPGHPSLPVVPAQDQSSDAEILDALRNTLERLGSF